MKIQYLGHSCFLFTAESGNTILTDPYGDIGYAMPRVFSDVVTVSHAHYDHCNVGAVSGSPVVLSGERPFSGFAKIFSVPSFHDGAHGALRGRNTIFVYEIDGLRLCHLGDIGEDFSEDLARKIGRVDILFVPVGGHYTVDAEGARRYVLGLNPSAAIPMHYRTKGLTVDVAGAEPFLRLFPNETVKAGSEWEVTKKTLPASLEIRMMERIGHQERL